jgi:sortase A
MRRLVRFLGLLMIVGGLGTLAWAVTVWQWQDPFTAVYTKWQQGRLGSQLDARMRAWQPPRPILHPVVVQAVPAQKGQEAVPTQRGQKAHSARAATIVPASALAAERTALALDGEAYRKSLHEGDAFARMTVSRLGLHNMVVVNGTAHDSLTKGPGRYLGSYLPGEGKLIYIAGHRTTYLAPFSHIDALRPGDRVTLELPYATFTYAVTRHTIVPANDLDVLKSHGREELVLQACHPRFFATHRYLAYAKLVRVDPKPGPAYAVDGKRVTAVR